MNKADLIRRMSEKLGIPQVLSKKIINSTLVSFPSPRWPKIPYKKEPPITQFHNYH